MTELWEKISMEYSSVAPGGGGLPKRPPPRNRKNCCRKQVLSSREYTFGEETELKEILSKNLWKNQFFIEILIKKLKIFFIFGSNAQSSAERFLNFWCRMEVVRQMVMIFNYSKKSKSSRFSPKVSRIFMPFSIVLLYLCYFLINLSTW